MDFITMSSKSNNGYISYISQTPITPTPMVSDNKIKRISKMFSLPSRKKVQLNTPESITSSSSSPSLKSSSQFDYRFSSPKSTLTGFENISNNSFLFNETTLVNTTTNTTGKDKRISRFNFRDLKCIFCDEPLLCILEDEDPPIVLTCSHKSHPECFLMALDRTNVSYLPTCPICNIETGCEDEIVEENMTRKLLLQDESYDDDRLSFHEDEMDTSTPITANPPSPNLANIMELDDPKTPVDQIITNASNWTDHDEERSKESMNEYILSHITSPKVSFLPEVSKLNLSLPNDQQFFQAKCFATVSGPSYHLCPTPNKENVTLLITEMMHKLNEEVEDWKGIDLADLGELITFDFLQVGIDGEEFTPVRCFLFEKIILILNSEGTQIEGTILMTHISSCVETDDKMVQLNLKIELLPLAYLNSFNKIITKKWFHLISKVLLLNPDEDEFQFDDNQLIQLSTNAWSLITKNKSLIPFTKPSLKISEMTIPKPSPIPITMIVCLSLVHTTNLSNHEYLQYLKQIIKRVLSSLNERDSFGLVTIGKDPITGEFAANGTFIGTASPTWNEWDEIIENLTVCQDKIFNDDYDKLYQSLLHSIKLISSNMEFNDAKRIKKLMLITNSQDDEEEEHIDDTTSVIKETEIREMISIIEKKYAVEIDSYLIGDKYSLKYLYYLSNCLKIITVENGFYQASLGSNFKRFDNYESFVSELPDIMKELEDIVVPHFEITITTQSAQEILISSMENPTNGETIELLANFDQIKISIFNLKINDSKTFLLTLAIDKNQLLGNSFKEVPLATVQGTWFNTLYETDLELTTMKIALSNHHHHHHHHQSSLSFKDQQSMDMQSLLSDGNNGGDRDVVQLPLLPPLISSQREILYIKREIELLFIKSLITSIDYVNSTKILETISLIWGILKSCNGNSLVIVNCQSVRLRYYIKELCAMGQKFHQLLQDESTQNEAIKNGYDLCFKIALQ